MKFDADIDRAPRNTGLMLQHREYGVGIGVIQRHKWGDKTHETVQFSHVKIEPFGSIPPGVSTPSPINTGDLEGWVAMPFADYSSAAADRHILQMEKAIKTARDRLASVAEYGDFETITSTISSVADDLHGALKVPE